MFDKPFHLQIVTPSRVVYKAEAVSVSAPGSNGGFQILYNHAPFVSALEVGRIKVMKQNGSEDVYATAGGFLEVRNNAVVVLADSVELASEIDRQRAVAARERAEARLSSKDPGIDPDRARLALFRALNRLRIANRA